MPPFRNPFGRKPPVVNGATSVEDENTPPAAPNGIEKETPRPDYAASRASSSLSIKGRKEEPSEYKLSGTVDSSNPRLEYLPLTTDQWSMIAAYICL